VSFRLEQKGFYVTIHHSMGKKNLMIVLVTGGILVIVSLLALAELRAFSGPGYNWNQCPDKSDRTCVDAAIKRWQEIDYSESKDLAKAFLTILVAVFVASITFSEKIIDLKNASTASIVAMLACWILLLISIITCGLGLTFITFALYQATYIRELPGRLERDAGLMFGFSGAAFIVALFAMLVAGLPSLFPKEAGSNPANTGGETVIEI